jgi:hypothetical protein
MQMSAVTETETPRTRDADATRGLILAAAKSVRALWPLRRSR